MSDISMYCSRCGAKYIPNSAGSAPITCACYAPFVGSVTFEPGEDGRVRSEWEIALDPDPRAGGREGEQ